MGIAAEVARVLAQRLHRFLISSPDLGIDASFSLFTPSFVHRFLISSPDLRIAAASSLLQLKTARLQRSRGVQAGTGSHEGGIILSKKPSEWRPVPAATASCRKDILPQRHPAAKTSRRNDIHQKDYHPRVLTRKDDCHRGEQGGEARSGGRVHPRTRAGGGALRQQVIAQR